MSDQRKEKPKHLGRGLQSLIGPIISAEDQLSEFSPRPPGASNFPPDKDLGDALQQIPIASISPNPHQARAVWDEGELVELAESIKANGVIQPIVVRRAARGFELIAGERRLKASQIAKRETIPALVRDATEEQMHEWSLVENIHRADLNPIERARAYKKYVGEFSLTQAQAAERIGEDRSVVANYLRLLDLPDEIQQMLIDGQLAMGHARAILGLPTDDLRRRLAHRAMAGRLSVREVERLVRKALAEPTRGKPAPNAKPAHIADLEDKLSSELGTKVSIETWKGGRRGKIIIEFYSLDEFDNITERIGLSTTELLEG